MRFRHKPVLAAVLLVAAATVVPGRPAAAAVTAVEGQTVISAVDSNPVKTVVASCPAGKRILGGGGALGGAAFTGLDHIVITEMRPITSTTGDAYQVSASEDQIGETGNWTLAATARCGNPGP